MEKTVSIEERIRRAEEIYARRKNDYIGTSTPYTRVSLGERRKANPLKKMLIQILICALIYTGFYVIKNGKYIFTGQITEQINNLLAYDMNIEKISEDILKYINKIRNKDVIIPEENKEENISEENVDVSVANIEEASETNETSEIKPEIAEQLSEEILGVTDEAQYTEDANEINQELTSPEYIKQNYSIIKPLEGTITSRFGTRNPTTPTVPTYHTGIDIAREVGTKIIAAMEGNVTQVSEEGDYRKAF